MDEKFETNEENINENEYGEEINPAEQDAEKAACDEEVSEVKKEKSMAAEIFEWVQAIVVAVVLAMFLRTFVFTLVNVSGSSMVPTLHNNDKLFVWRLGYEPKVGDIIIFRPKEHEDTPYVKRVIAEEGQTVDIKFNEAKGFCEVFVDGELIEEDYINDKIDMYHMGNMEFPAKVPQNCVFAMGDNRNNSKDSRYMEVGMVTENSIIGHATARLWPFNALGILD